MKKYSLIMLVTFVAIHTLSAQQNEFGWLTGTWKLKDKNVYEHWKVADDGKTLEGISYGIKNTDTTIMEQILLTYEGGSFHYKPDVAGNQERVDFKISKLTSDSFVAENQLHDFPKVIRYRLVRKEDKDFIEASIEGNGKVIPYLFQRLK